MIWVKESLWEWYQDLNEKKDKFDFKPQKCGFFVIEILHFHRFFDHSIVV